MTLRHTGASPGPILLLHDAAGPRHPDIERAMRQRAALATVLAELRPALAAGAPALLMVAQGAVRLCRMVRGAWWVALTAAGLAPATALAGGLGFDGLALSHGQARGGDARVTTLGGWSHFHGGYGGIDISYTDSDWRGDTLALAMGIQGPLAASRVAPLLGYGVRLGYNADPGGLEAAMYPELGLRVDLSGGHMLLVQARYYVTSLGRDSDYASYGATLRWAWR